MRPPFGQIIHVNMSVARQEKVRNFLRLSHMSLRSSSGSVQTVGSGQCSRSLVDLFNFDFRKIKAFASPPIQSPF